MSRENRRVEHHLGNYTDGRTVQFVQRLYRKGDNRSAQHTFATITAHIPGYNGGEEVCLYLDLDSLCGLLRAAMLLRAEWPQEVSPVEAGT